MVTPYHPRNKENFTKIKYLNFHNEYIQIRPLVLLFCVVNYFFFLKWFRCSLYQLCAASTEHNVVNANTIKYTSYSREQCECTNFPAKHKKFTALARYTARVEACLIEILSEKPLTDCRGVFRASLELHILLVTRSWCNEYASTWYKIC